MSGPDGIDPGFRFDPLVPHPAWVYGYWLGGKDHYAADREVAEEVIRHRPQVVAGARANRAFLARVVRYLAAECGVRQYLDIGTGLPAPASTHKVAQAITPGSRVVYVDNDPLVLVHARALLTSSPQGSTHYVEANMGDPATVLREAGRWLDLSQPVGLTFMGVLGHVTDHGQACAIVAGLMDGLAAGSYLAINDSVNTSEALEAALRTYEASGAVPYRTRSPEQFAGYFEGLELVEPGVVLVADWRPDPGADRGPDIPQFGAVGRKR